MTVEDALIALGESPEAEFPVVVMRNERDRLTAAPVLGVALDDSGEEVSLLRGDFLEDEEALEGALSITAVREALEEIGPAGAGWPLFSVASADEVGVPGGSLVGFSISEEIEIFAFLQGPKSEWEED